MKITLLLLYLSSVFHLAFSQQASWEGSAPGGFSAKITVSSTELSISDPLTIQMSLSFPPTHHPNTDVLIPHLLTYDGFDEPPFYLLKKIEISPQKTTNDLPQGLASTHVTITLAPQTPGKHFLTFYKIPFEPNSKDSSDKSIDIISGIFNINILIPPLDFQPLSVMAPPMSLTQKPPISLLFSNRHQYMENPQILSQEASQTHSFIQTKSFPLKIVLAIAAFLLIILIIKMPLPTSTKQHIVSEPQQSLRSLTLQKLDDLSSQQLPQNGLYDPFFTQLDHILRSFIENHFLINATSLTSHEFLVKAASMPSLDAKAQSTLSDFLSHSDRVKFAQYHPSLNECTNALNSARQFIENSTS